MPKFLSDSEFNYGTLVLSTAGHWTTSLMSAFRDEEAGDEAGYGIANVKSFFEIAMREWAFQVQEAIRNYRSKGGRRPKQVVVRAYLPRNHYEPWTEIEPYQWRWYNWPWIRDFNEIFMVSRVFFSFTLSLIMTIAVPLISRQSSSHLSTLTYFSSRSTDLAD